MTSTGAVTEPISEYLYTPERVRSILRNWDAYLAREQNPMAARGLFIKGPTPESPKLGARQKGYHGDPMSGVPIVADIRKAFGTLYARDQGSLECVTVSKVMAGWSISEIARTQQVGKERTWDSFNQASERMAAFLGWVGVEEEE